MSDISDYDIDPVKGARVYLQTFITEDSLRAAGSGGVQSLVLGSFGTGKSTLLLWIAELARYMTKGGRDAFISRIIHKQDTSEFKTKPTTVVYRCRDLDAWILTIPENWKARVPDITPKKIALFVHDKDLARITFFVFNNGKPAPVPNLPEIQTYESADDLCSKLVIGALNVVLEPQTYRLSRRLADLVTRAKSQFIGAAPVPDTQKDDLEENPIKRRGRPPKPPKVVDYTEYAVKTGFFWVEMVAATMAKFGGKPILFVWDEMDDWLSGASAEIGWWCIQVYTELQRDFRKSNISVCGTSHGWNLLADSVYKRCTHRIYFPGVKSGKNTLIRQTYLFSSLKKGQFLAEKNPEYFGIGVFQRIPDPMQCKIDGLINTFESLNQRQREDIRAVYERNWSLKRKGGPSLPDIIDLDNTSRTELVPAET